MNYRFKKSVPSGKAFTFTEVLFALSILAFICVSVLVVIERGIETAIELKDKKEAFELARENMEKLLAMSSVGEEVQYGVSENNPEIEWEVKVEPFYESQTGKVWAKAISSAIYYDKNNQEQKVEFTHWVTELPQEMMSSIIGDADDANSLPFDPNELRKLGIDPNLFGL